MAHAHLRYLYPFPANLGDMLKRYRRVLIPELNLGQLRMLIRGTYLVDAGFNKSREPFTVEESDKIKRPWAGTKSVSQRDLAKRRRKATGRQPQLPFRQWGLPLPETIDPSVLGKLMSTHNCPC